MRKFNKLKYVRRIKAYDGAGCINCIDSASNISDAVNLFQSLKTRLHYM